MLPLPLLHFANTLLQCCSRRQFKVATPDVSVPVFISTIRQETVVLFMAKHIKVKAFSTSHS
jgi:hypothetical protein